MGREEDEYEGDRSKIMITVLFRKASARCCAPTCPIVLLLSFSVVSVYVLLRRR